MAKVPLPSNPAPVSMSVTIDPNIKSTKDNSKQNAKINLTADDLNLSNHEEELNMFLNDSAKSPSLARDSSLNNLKNNTSNHPKNDEDDDDDEGTFNNPMVASFKETVSDEEFSGKHNLKGYL